MQIYPIHETIQVSRLSIRKENTFIEHRIKDVKEYSKPLEIEKRFLTIMACHSNSPTKLKTIENNIKYFKIHNNDIIVINSKDESHSKATREIVESQVLGYFEIPNNSHLDIGKWNHVLRNFDLTPYDYIVFTNDSFIIKGSIIHFFGKMIRTNVELYGYNDSTQVRYHYQSYLFGIRKDAVFKLIRHYLSRRHLLTCYDQVVEHIELNLTRLFNTKDCFLKIGYFQGQFEHNIFFNNDRFYKKLLKTKLLPFVKLKRL